MLGAGCPKNKVEPPAPKIDSVAARKVAPIPVLPASTVEAPITLELAPTIATLEAAVPRQFGNLEEKRPIASNPRAHAAFSAERSPFEISVRGQTILLRTVVSYAGRGWYDPKVGPEVSGSCGTSGERPRAVVEIVTTFSMTPAWRLAAASKIARAEPLTTERRDQCRVTFLQIDVTDRVMNATRGILESRLSGLDQRIAAIDMKSRFERWWQLLQRPIRITNDVWLLLEPSAVQLGRVRAVDDAVDISIGLTIAPHVVTGPRPQDSVTPLPTLGTTKARGDSMHVLLEGALTYEVASAALQKALLGKKIRKSSRYLVVRHVGMSGIGDGRVVVAVGFDGTVAGHVYLVGTPKYDPTSDELFIPDLDFDLATANALVRGLEWMKHGEMRDEFRRRARWPATKLVQTGMLRVERAINRELTKGVRLEGKLHHADVLDVRASQEAIVVLAHADGQLRLRVNRSVVKKPKPRPPTVANAKDPSRAQ